MLGSRPSSRPDTPKGHPICRRKYIKHHIRGLLWANIQEVFQKCCCSLIHLRLRLKVKVTGMDDDWISQWILTALNMILTKFWIRFSKSSPALLQSIAINMGSNGGMLMSWKWKTGKMVYGHKLTCCCKSSLMGIPNQGSSTWLVLSGIAAASRHCQEWERHIIIKFFIVFVTFWTNAEDAKSSFP